MEQAYGPNWYVSVFGGASFARAQAQYNGDANDIRLNDGFSLGAVVGHHLGNGFRVESEISYFANDNDKFREDNGGYDPLSGDTAAVFALRNLWKDIRLSDAVQPYVGGGLGVGLLMSDGFFDDDGDIDWDDSSLGLAGQIGAGVRVALSDRMALDAGYRFKAVIDATFDGTTVGDDENGEFSFYTHSAQLGVSYALGEGSRIMSSGGDPSDWYVSLFGGATETVTNWSYSDDNPYLFEHDTGFTIGAAIGTHLAPGLRTELEVSYLRAAVESYTDEADDNNEPASGDLEQGYLLGNIWKDFDWGVLTPYVGAGVGFGFVHFDDGVVDGDTQSDDTGYGLAGQFGFGARIALGDDLSLDLGYRFKSIVDAFIIGGGDDTDNSDVSTYSHVAQLGLNYGLGAGGGDIPEMTSRYVSLFGGAVVMEDHFSNVDSHDYRVEFDTGFTVGAAVGGNLTETLRGELELSYLSYDVDSVDNGGTANPTPDGEVDSYFLLANVWRDFEIGGFTPYAGGGVGVALMDVNIDYGDDNHVVDDTSLALAAQLGAGLMVPITDNLTLDAGYRFKAALGVLTEGDINSNNDDHTSGTFYAHTGQVGVVWNF